MIVRVSAHDLVSADCFFRVVSCIFACLIVASSTGGWIKCVLLVGLLLVLFTF